MKDAVNAARTIVGNFRDDPEAATRDLHYRVTLFLDPPDIAGGACERGCCVSVHIRDDVIPEVMDAVSNGIRKIREEGHGPIDDGDDGISVV